MKGLSDDNTLVQFSATNGTSYAFADPMTIAMFKDLWQLSRENTSCIRGSYWLAGIEADAKRGETNTLAKEMAALPFFC